MWSDNLEIITCKMLASTVDDTSKTNVLFALLKAASIFLYIKNKINCRLSTTQIAHIHTHIKTHYRLHFCNLELHKFIKNKKLLALNKVIALIMELNKIIKLIQ